MGFDCSADIGMTASSEVWDWDTFRHYSAFPATLLEYRLISLHGSLIPQAAWISLWALLALSTLLCIAEQALLGYGKLFLQEVRSYSCRSFMSVQSQRSQLPLSWVRARWEQGTGNSALLKSNLKSVISSLPQCLGFPCSSRRARWLV